MNSRTQALIKSISITTKLTIRSISRMITPAPNSMPSSCLNINALLLHLCDFDERTYRYIMKWLAYPLRNPGAKMQHSLMVNGQEGTGSSLFFDKVVGKLYGDGARRLRGHHLHDMFNDWTLGARFLIIDGAIPRGAAGKVKALASGTPILVERKGMPNQQIANEINIVVLTHSNDFLPLSSCDRRFMAVEAPPAREQLFYRSVLAEIENGGVDAFRDYLLKKVCLDGFNQFSEPPRNLVTGRMETAQCSH